MTHNEQRKAALEVLDGITNCNEYKLILAAYTTIKIFTEFEMFMFAWEKHDKLKEKGLI